MLYGLGLIAGVVLAIQNPFNVNLGNRVHSAFLSGFVTYVIASLYFVLILNVLGAHPLIVLGTAWQQGRIWMAAGLLSAGYVGSIILIFPKIGAVNAVIFPIMGQIISGVLIDSVGLLNVNPMPFTLIKFLGVVMMLLGVICSAYVKNTGAQSKKPNWLYLIWGFVAGILLTLMGIFNGNLGTILTQDPKLGLTSMTGSLGASFIAFSIGALAFLCMAILKKEIYWSSLKTGFKSPLAWSSAVMGAFYVFCLTLLNPAVGPGLTISLNTVGLIIGTTGIEHFGWFKVQQHTVTWLKALGIIFLIVGVILIKVIG
ncbi:DMT family transporter [Weissella kandleri]|uniref:DMT family transporter n=1 Tax=Weissella kandleri TaxID=1616 RepID=UPI00387E4F5C